MVPKSGHDRVGHVSKRGKSIHLAALPTAMRPSLDKSNQMVMRFGWGLHNMENNFMQHGHMGGHAWH